MEISASDEIVSDSWSSHGHRDPKILIISCCWKWSPAEDNYSDRNKSIAWSGGREDCCDVAC